MNNMVGLKKGVNLGGWLSQCVHTVAHYDNFILESDIKKISEWGLDHVRVPVDSELFETDDGTFIEERFAYIDTCISWCQKYNLTMILDIHKTAGYTFNNAYGEANSLFKSEALQQRFVNVWRELARRYGDYRDVVVFELLNEVVEVENSEPWNALVKRAIEGIRAFAPTTRIIVGGIEWNSVRAVELLDLPYDEYVIYTFHFYEPFAFTHQNAGWVPTTKDIKMDYPSTYEAYVEAAEKIGTQANFFMNSDVKEMGMALLESLVLKAITVAKERGVDLYCGEYGVIDQATPISTLNWYKDMHTIFEKYGIGRAAWSYKRMNFGLEGEHYAPVIDGIIASL